MRVFGIDPGSERTGYGCVETDGRVARLVACGAITVAATDPFPQRLARIHRDLVALLNGCAPECVAIETLFHAANVRSALKLGHARGVAVLAAVQAGCPVVEYTPAEVKRAVVGYGRAEKQQIQHMVQLLLGLASRPSPHDAADALAVAICHLHSMRPRAIDLKAGLDGAAGGRRTDREIAATPDGPGPRGRNPAVAGPSKPRTWRQYRPPSAG